MSANRERRRILFVTLSNIGDLVMATPVLKALHAHYHDRSIDIVADPRSSQLLEACPFRGDIYLKHKRAAWVARWRFVQQLRRRDYELIVDLRGRWLSLMLRGRKRVSKAAYSDPSMHAVEHHFTALRQILAEATAIPDPEIWYSPAARERARQLLQAGSARRWLAIAPGANWPGKIWPASAYAELSGRVAQEFDALCLFGGPGDAAAAAAIEGAAALPVVNLVGRTSLVEAAACLHQMRLFVGNDSGLGHMAAALGVPTLTVFGPGQPERYRPWGERASIVLAPEQDLARLSASTVAAAVEQSLHSAA